VPSEAPAEAVAVPEPPAPEVATTPGAGPGPVTDDEVESSGAAGEAPAAVAEAAAGPSLADVRRLWPEVLDRIRGIRRFTWVMLSQNAQVSSLDQGRLTIALVNAGARDSFVRSGSEDIVRQVLAELWGVDWRIETVVDPSAEPSGGSGEGTGGGPAATSSPASTAPRRDPAPAPGPAAASTPPTDAAPSARGGGSAAKEAIRRTRQGPGDDAADRPSADDGVDRDDPTIEDDLDHEALLKRELGATVIDEEPHG